eukprot:15469808-Alexandrium_andersonii.AAC.1
MEHNGTPGTDTLMNTCLLNIAGISSGMFSAVPRGVIWGVWGRICWKASECGDGSVGSGAAWRSRLLVVVRRPGSVLR